MTRFLRSPGGRKISRGWSYILAMQTSIARVAAVLLLGFASVAVGQTSGPAEPKSLAFVVYRVEERPGGEFIVTFQNGEVWQQYRPDKKLYLARGEQVVIRRSSSNIYTLVARDGQTTRVMRMR